MRIVPVCKTLLLNLHNKEGRKGERGGGGGGEIAPFPENKKKSLNSNQH